MTIETQSLFASACLALALSTQDATSQEMPAPKDSTRIVKLHDALQLVTVDVPGQSAEDERKARSERLERIAGFARTFVTPPLAAEEDITCLSGRYLVALARPAQQKWIEKLIARNVAQGMHQVDLEVRMLRIPAKHFEDLLPPFGMDPAPEVPNKPQAIGPGRYQALLDDTELNLILRAVEKTKGAQMVRTPRLLMTPMAPASVSVGNQIDYVRDYDVQVLAGKQIATPVHASLFDGMRLDASCGLVRDKMLGVSFRYEEREVEKPIKEFKTKLGTSEELTVQLPASTVLKLEQQLELLNGQTALLAVKDGTGPHLMVLVRASLVPNEPAKNTRR